MDTKISKARYYFGFRLESGLDEQAQLYCNNISISFNELIENAIVNLCHLHDQRKVLLNKSTSVFHSRQNLKDRVDTMLILKAAIREQVWSFAVCYRKSMAEIIRIALELYLDSLDSDKIKLDNIKHNYRHPQLIIECTIIGLYPIYPPKTQPPEPIPI